MVYISHLEASDLMSADFLPLLTLKTHSSSLVVSARKCFHVFQCTVSPKVGLRPLVKLMLFYMYIKHEQKKFVQNLMIFVESKNMYTTI